MEFRDAVKYLRNELGLTQMELANALHVTATTIGRWERGLNLPNKAICATLLEFARTRAVSKACMEMLKKTADAAARAKLAGADDVLYAVEHASLRELVEEAFFPLYVCDMETDELLYINDKAEGMVGAPLSALPDRRCYKNLMHRDAPCDFCHKDELREDCMTSYEVVCGIDDTPYRVYAKRIRWNGRDAHVRYLSPSDSSKQLKDIIENMNGGVTAIIYGADGSLRHAYRNVRYYEMFGYTREQFDSEMKVPYAIVAPEDAGYVRSIMDTVRTSGQPTTFRYRANRRDGELVFVSCSSSLASIEGFADKVLLSVMTDITETVKTEQMLKAQRDQIDEMLNTTPCGIAVIEVDPRRPESLRTTYYNDRFFSFSGYTREEYDAILKHNELSFVFEEDAPLLLADTEKICAGEIGGAANSTVRCHTKDGGYRWLLLTGQLAEKREGVCVVKVSMVDVTARKEAEDKQRISEEMLRVAAETDKRVLITYDAKANTCHVESRNLYAAKYGETLENIPESLIDTGVAAPESIADLCDLFTRIRAGERAVRVSLSLRTGAKEYQWFECNASTVLDADGKPDHAVLVFHDITEQRLKEAVYKKWRQSISAKPPESYTLFRCNLNKRGSFDETDGALLKRKMEQSASDFAEITKAYADRFVYPDDQEAYGALLDADTLLSMFYRGEHTATLEYRETGEDGALSWRLLTVEMVEYPDSTDVQAFLLFEDVDEKKRAQLKELERAETDPLTGVLNRVAFTQRVDALIDQEPGEQHALLMMDMDGFKLLNDTFGHAAGDQVLLDVAAVMRSLIREGDLICRLGGDEFLVCLRSIPYDAVIGKKARQICEQVRKAFRHDVQISASIGVSVYPRDGSDFDTLYHCADRALYRVKQAGKNNYAFFSANDDEQLAEKTEARAVPETPLLCSNVKVKRRMLIVDDDNVSRAILGNLFKDEYVIETARNGAEAVMRLRHFTSSVSIVLLDLVMPGMDGYEVLQKMQSIVELQAIPVIVVTGDDDHATLLKAIESGATDYVTKPVDPDLIRLRVKAAVSKAENERLRAQNGYLQLQRDEELKFRMVLESTGTVVIEYDWFNRVFIYDNTISKYLAGNYNHRSLWQVFLADMVAESPDVKVMQDGLLRLANDRQRSSSSMLVLLKTPEKQKHWFRMNVYKQANDLGLTDKMIITFNDVHEEVLANQQLKYQATRDELTGLYNRAGFMEKAAEMIDAKSPGYYVMACIDIEKFKVINDQYGSKKGDEVLRGLANVLKEMNDGKEVACCRVMADNFAVLYPAKLIGSAMLAAAHDASELLDGSLPPLKICVGRCVVADKTLSVSAIYDRAAIAKETVKGRYDVSVATYDESMRAAILRQQEITGQMKQALESKQFEVWLQPQFNHANGMLTGAEALVRWRHPKEGLISPAVFVPIFERNGFIYEMDKFVWEQTCMLLRKWLDQGVSPAPVSVNISRYDVFREDLVGIVTGLVKKYGLPLELLRLEITESAFSQSAEQIIRVVKQFVALGFTVEIDDFGSGYSSLNTLKDVPAQVLKMDMRFLENDRNSQRGGSIIESVVRMAKWLGMAVIAEGVETMEQADYLKSIGCLYMQGYLYSKPIPAAEYEKLYMNGNSESKLDQLKAMDTWNNNAFWNPKSMETLIFNSYIGGACIFEYYNGTTELLRYNDAYAEIFRDFSDSDYLTNRKNVFDMLDEENTALVKNNIETALRTKKESTCENKFVNAAGQALYVRTTLRQIAQTGDRSLFYCVAADVTAQREAERGEREAAARIAAIMDSINAGVAASVVEEGRIRYLFANDRYYELMGYDKASYEAQFSGSFDAIHPDDRARVNAVIAESAAMMKDYSVEFRIICRNGDIRWVFCNINIVKLPDVGKPVHLATVNDTTALHLAKQKEQETAERIRAVMDNATSGITAVVLHKNGTAEYLLVNDRYFELVGYTRAQYEAAGLTGLELMHPDDLREYEKQIIGLDTVGQVKSFEFRAKRRDGQWVWLRDDIAVIALNGIDAPVQLSCFTDITARKRADERLRFVNELARAILSEADNDQAIRNTLYSLMTYFKADRGYIVELDHQRGISTNTYEVCADGVPSEKALLQNLPFSESDFWYATLTQRNFLLVEDVDALEDTALQALLRAQGIRSIVLAPLWRNGRLIGFAGVDNPAAMLEDVERLTAPSDYLTLLLSRRDLNREIERSNTNIAQLLRDTPGGFCRMAIHSGESPKLVTLNDGFCRLLGMTEQEIRDAYGDDMYGCFVMEDVKASLMKARDARRGEKQYSAKCRVRRKDGACVWVMAYGRFVNDDAGDTYLNVYFTEITAQKRAEELCANLMDNLACGVALYEVDGERVSVIHINKSYWQLVGREPTDYTDADVLGAVHPEDRPVLALEIAACIRQHRSFACDFRVTNGTGGYTPFHVTATMEREENGKYLFYTTYTPISTEIMSIQEMLPVALSTMMSTLEDLSFIKDADGRYITCSKTVLDLLGLSDVQALVGKTSGEVFGASAVKQSMREDQKIFETGKPMLDRLIKLPAKDGARALYSTSKYPLLDGSGKVIGIYTVCRDVTAEKATEFELNTLLRVIPSGVLKYSADDEAAFAYINRNLIESLGYTEAQFREKFHNRFTEMIYAEDRARAEMEIAAQEGDGKVGRFDYRVEDADGQLHWFHDEGVRIVDGNGKAWYYVTLVDITAQKKGEGALRLAEEEYRLATRHSGYTIGRYDVRARTLTITEDAATRLALSECIQDVPYGRVERGEISEDTADAYIAFYEGIMLGEKESAVTFKKLLPAGWRWITMQATTIFDEEGQPVSAIISYRDVTEQQEKELAYKRWQQSMEGRDPKTYTLFRCNLNKNVTYDMREGELLTVVFDDSLRTFNDRTDAFARQYVLAEDRERYAAFVNSDAMLAAYYRNHRSDSIEYREQLPDGGIRWIKLSVDLVEAPHSTDIEAFLFYENIDEQKRTELETRHMAETDPLTGLLNRKSFSEKVNALLHSAAPGTRYAFLMLDIDGFKNLNDTLGHASGDEALVVTAQTMCALLRKDDLIGRLGGDEFVAFLKDINSDANIRKKAEMLCRRLNKAFKADVPLTVSIGASVYPRDGEELHALYEKADAALYAAKGGGKNTFRIYTEAMEGTGEHAPLKR